MKTVKVYKDNNKNGKLSIKIKKKTIRRLFRWNRKITNHPALEEMRGYDEKFKEAHDDEKSSRCANFEKLFQKISRNHKLTDVTTR